MCAILRSNAYFAHSNSNDSLFPTTLDIFFVFHHAGCRVATPTCTAIRGQLSAAYSGLDEYSVTHLVVNRLRAGMDDGFFLPPGSPALKLEFVSAGGAVPVGGGASSYQLNTARGTAPDAPPEEETNLSKYGVLFVCFVAVLGAATVAATFVRYRKRQKRIARAKGEEGVEWSEEDHAAIQQVQTGVEVAETKTTEEGDSLSVAESPASENAVVPATSAVPPATSRDVVAVDMDDNEGEVEIVLSGSKSFDV